MNALIEPIKQSPKFKDILEELNEHWKTEKKRRLQFYNEVTPSVKWEFINGEIIVHSPVKLPHLTVSSNLSNLLGTYVRAKKLGVVHVEKAMITLTRNDYEPDIVFFDKKQTTKFNEETWQFPAPKMIVEILSKSTAKLDRGIKFDDYAAHGVQEYWIIDPKNKSVEQYKLGAENIFELYSKKLKGDIIQSFVITNFKIPVGAIFDENADLFEISKQLLK